MHQRLNVCKCFVKHEVKQKKNEIRLHALKCVIFESMPSALKPYRNLLTKGYSFICF